MSITIVINVPEGSTVDYDQSNFDQALPPGVPAIVAEDPAITVATDSGEPELEDIDSGPIDGTWTLSADELKSRLDEAYEHGVKDGKPALETVTSERTLRIIASELDARLNREGGYPENPTRAQVFGPFAIELAKRLGWTVNA